MTMHCACNNDECDCSYPQCHTGRRLGHTKSVDERARPHEGLATADLLREIARLHEELAKANGSCYDMASELKGLLTQLQEVEWQRDRLQVTLEEVQHQLDVLRSRR